MDPKRPDVRMEDKPDEDGVVTGRDRNREDGGRVRALFSRLASVLRRE
ncbi:hypothetical protein [Halobiforma nitratireducens]|nr:hypothetical protein [Halobiforma nitratireducens]